MSRFNKIGRWLAFVFCFIAIPAMLMFYGINYLKAKASQNRLDKNYEELSRFYKDMSRFADPQNFWCSYLTLRFAPDNIDKGNASAEIVKKLTDSRKKLKFNYIVYSPGEGVISTTLPLEPRDDWALSLSMAWKINDDKRHTVTEIEQRAGGRIFGPQLNWTHCDNCTRADNFYLVAADSTFKKPYIWCNIVHNQLILVFIDPRDLESIEGIWNFLADFSNSSGGLFRFSLRETKTGFRHAAIPPGHAAEVEQAADQYDRQKFQRITTADFIVFPMFLKPGLTIFGYVHKNSIIDNSMQKPIWLFVILFTLAAAALARYSWRLTIGGQPDSLSLRWKLRFLFFFANGLPLLVLFFIGNDYLNQKRDNLLLEMHGKGISFMQDFDEKIEVEYARSLVNKEKAQTRLIERLSYEEISDASMKEFSSSLGTTQLWRFYLIASSSKVIGTEIGVYDEERNIVPAGADDNDYRSKNQTEFIRKLGQFFLDKINGAKISDKVATELELLIESTTQKPLANFVFDLLQSRGYIIQWGFGQNVNPSIIDSFSLKNSKSMDFFFIAVCRRMDFQRAFLKEALAQANRNNLGLKLIAMHEQKYCMPPEAFQSSILRDFALKLSLSPGKEIKFVDYEGKKYLAMGFEGKYLKEYKLVGLYPLEKIDSLINSQRRQLIFFAILSLLMTFGLSQVLAQGFIIPLQLITEGAKAIENKHFSHRLPDLGRDEFGAMGKVFNDVMVDLEELSVASAIQEQLLPQQQIETGRFSLFGRSISMGELGGDYYDYLGLENKKFSVLLGDVAGHGVGAALIMAMAKAGIIQSEHLLDQPLALLTRLHGLILSSKTKKQKKIMTFQYLYLDGMTGRGVYSNAGACSPIVVRKSAGTAEELTLAGGALGAFKKANFSEVELVFNPGDAIIFYTDGIVEARNSSGEELGYDRLRTLLQEAWDANAETYYHNIFRAYLQHVGNEDATDDLTMVVLVYGEVSENV